MNMHRRGLLRAFAAFGSAAALPSFAALSAGESFDAAAAASPWLKPFKGIAHTNQDLRCDALAFRACWKETLSE